MLPGLGAYTGDALIEAAMLLPEWYLPAATGTPTPPEETARYIARLARNASPRCPRGQTPCCCATTTRTICCGCRRGPA